MIPSSALAWGAVNHIGPAAAKVEKLAKTLQIPATNLLDTAEKESGIEKGIDEKGAAGYFIVPGKWTPDPPVAIFIAVKDVHAFRSNFEIVKVGEKISEIKMKSAYGPAFPSIPGFLAFVHGYAIIADHNKAAVEAAVESKQSIAADMAGYESWLAENDASVVGTAAGIKLASEQIRDELKASKTAGSDPASELFQRTFGNALAVAPNEVLLAMAGIRCDKQGNIRVIGRGRLVQGGTVSKAIAQLPPLKDNLLSGVSGGPFVVAVAGIGIPGLADSCVPLLSDMLNLLKSLGKAAAADDMVRMLKESAEAVRQVHSMSFVWKVGRRSDPIFSNMYGSVKLDDAEKFLAAQEKYLASLAKLNKESKELMTKSIETKRLLVAGKPAMQTEMTYDFSGLPDAEAARGTIDEMFGPSGKLQAYYVADDKQTAVYGIGVPQERMVTALDVLSQPKKSLAEDAELAATAAMLPAGAVGLLYQPARIRADGNSGRNGGDEGHTRHAELRTADVSQVPAGRFCGEGHARRAPRRNRRAHGGD